MSHDTRVLPLEAATLDRYQARCLDTPGWAESEPEHDAGLWAHIEANHRRNAALWAEEDEVRRGDLPPERIARFVSGL